jgi:hypothetical protein
MQFERGKSCGERVPEKRQPKIKMVRIGLWQTISGKASQPILAGLSNLQFICKFLYLFFPRDIHDPFGIVEEAFAQNVGEPGFEFCPFYEGWGNQKFFGL